MIHVDKKRTFDSSRTCGEVVKRPWISKSVWLAQLVKSLAASAGSLTQEVTGSTPGSDGLTQAAILSRSGEMNSNSKQLVTAVEGCGKVAALRIV